MIYRNYELTHLYTIRMVLCILSHIVNLVTIILSSFQLLLQLGTSLKVLLYEFVKFHLKIVNTSRQNYNIQRVLYLGYW